MRFHIVIVGGREDDSKFVGCCLRPVVGVVVVVEGFNLVRQRKACCYSLVYGKQTGLKL